MPIGGKGLVLPSLQLVAFTDGPERARSVLMHGVLAESPLGGGPNVSWAVPAGSNRKAVKRFASNVNIRGPEFLPIAEHCVLVLGFRH
jgi:hypothetical protein